MTIHAATEDLQQSNFPFRANLDTPVMSSGLKLHLRVAGPCKSLEALVAPPDSEERRWIEAAVREPVGTRWNAISQVTDQTEYGDYGQSAE